MNLIVRKVIPFMLLLWCSAGTLLAQQNGTNPDVDQNYFIVKFKNYTSDYLNRLNPEDIFPELSVAAIEPLHQPAVKAKNAKVSVLDGIYKIKLKTPSKHLLKSIDDISKRPDVVYAEPVYLDRPLIIPNDPLANPNSGSQYYLSSIKAYDAWDISTSESAIRIAILDTGIEPNHDDLGNIAFNENDPINGVDDDGNGLIDDYMGWDFADSDNDPTSDQSDHGLKVAGVSSAKVGNAIGIAGVGYSASFVPIKIFTSENGVSSNAYDAIIYAADQGYEILNLSWGSPNSFSQYRQDIIDYATLEKGVVIVAAAGNTPANLDFYPASYDHVLSVAATDENDLKAEFSTYSRKVDLTAPGSNIVSTEMNNGFSQGSGTSFSSPQVAGAAALLMSKYPDWTNIQIMEHLRVTTDNIDAISGNQEFENLLGSGRLNILNALTSTNTKSVRIEDFSFNNGIGEFAYYGDTVNVILDLQNILSPVNDLQLDISSKTQDVTVISPTVELGNLDSLIDRQATFQIVLSDSIDNNENLIFQIDYNGIDYNDVQFIEFETSDDRLDFGIGNSFITTNSKGELGHESNIISDGVGFRWDGKRLLENMGLMIGVSADSLVDNALTNVELLFRNNDLESVQNIKLFNHPEADIYAAGVLNSIEEVNTSLQVEHNYYAWENNEEASNIILEYRITNTASNDFDSVRVGLLSNWDINAAISNTAVWHQEDSIAIVYDDDNPAFSGMAILKEELPWNYNTIDVTQKSITENTNITKQEKFDQLSSLNTDSLINTDVIQTLSVLIPEIKSQQSVKIAFVLAGAEDYEGIRKQVEVAKSRYQKILVNPRVVSYATTCQGGDVVLSPQSAENFGFYSDSGASNFISEGDKLELTNLESDTVIYFRGEQQNGRKGDVFAFQVEVIPTIAEFVLSTDTLFLGANNRVEFRNTSEFTKSTSWNLGNGLLTNIENPSTVYEKEGVYNITLNIESVFGCTDSEVKQLVVVSKNPDPIVNSLDTICFANRLIINAVNSDSINIYGDEELTDLLFSGNEFESTNLQQDEIFYVTNVDGLFESEAVTVRAIIETVTPEILAFPDTLSLNESAIILKINPLQSLAASDWLIEGANAGSESESRFSLNDFEENNINVQVTAQSERGCIGIGNENITLQTTNLPFFSNQTVCKESPLIIEPMNGQYFAFYKDENDEVALGKGSTFKLEQINSDTSIYIRGLDGFLESAAIKIEILVEDFEANISSSLEKVTLNESGLAVEVLLTANGQNIESQQWYVDGAFVDISSQIKLFFGEEGVFEIKLIAENNNGCISEDVFQLEVSTESVITNIKADIETLIYPNPTNGVLNIPGYLENIELYTLAGEKILSRSTLNNELDISQLESGVYILKGWLKGENLINSKVILRK